MQTVSMSWQNAFELGVALTAAGGAASLSKNQYVRTAGAFARETAVIGFLYGLWQLAGQLSGTHTKGAFTRSHWIERAEHDVFLPSEHSMQQLILGHRYVVETANLYYDTMHFTIMFVFLLWLFVRHRDRYRPVRQVMAWTTLGCLLVQLMPVAPPRMLPGIVDTAMLYHQSVYANGYAIDQLSAMPSVHVAWAVCVGYYTWKISPSKWRYIGPLHSVTTIFVVVVTGNHFWADGIVAIMILATCAWGVFGVRTAWAALRQRRRGRSVDVVEPSLLPEHQPA